MQCVTTISISSFPICYFHVPTIPRQVGVGGRDRFTIMHEQEQFCGKLQAHWTSSWICVYSQILVTPSGATPRIPILPSFSPTLSFQAPSCPLLSCGKYSNWTSSLVLNPCILSDSSALLLGSQKSCSFSLLLSQSCPSLSPLSSGCTVHSWVVVTILIE